MNKKSFILGAVSGIVLTLVVLFVIGLVKAKSTTPEPIQYLENPVSYENKKETSFKVFQVLGNTALASEFSGKYSFGECVYAGNTVLLLGKNFYCDQVVTVKRPQRIGTFNYTSTTDRQMTVPVIDGEMK